MSVAHPIQMWERTAQAAYVAGLIDSGGYVGIKRRQPTPANRMRVPRYGICVSFAFSDLAPSQAVAAFCGLGDKVNARSRTGVARTSYQFDVEHHQATHLLQEVLPFLIAKRARADVCLEFAALAATSRQHRTKRLDEGSSVASGLTDAYVAQCNRLYASLLVGGAAGRASQ